jgi:hypothetical protein
MEKDNHTPCIGEKIEMLDFGNVRMSVNAFDLIFEDMERRRKIGPFYYYKDEIIAPLLFRKEVDTEAQTRGLSDTDAVAGEHRDMWDLHMTVKYPELKDDYADNHKALPRGRVDFHTKNGKLAFWVTLDKCIANKESEIKRVFGIKDYDVEFHYGTMNYKCKNCK